MSSAFCKGDAGVAERLTPIIISKPILKNTLQRYIVRIPTKGYTIKDKTINCLRIGINFTLNQTAQYVIIGNAQLEVGGIATTFERLPIAQTLALCQRYYETVYASAYLVTAAPNIAVGTFKVTKAHKPTMKFVRGWNSPGDAGTTVSKVNTSAVLFYHNATTSGGIWTAEAELN